jgi:gamma-glutamyltranspeptidase/glutathione hydrolase
MIRRRFLTLLCTLLVALTTRPLGQSSTWRPVVMADHGMVASGHPLASEAGLRVLKSGGNAIDAAVATWAVQGLTEPHMTGLGGDAFILIYVAKTREVKFINATGQAPLAATLDFYTSKGGLPADGPLSVIVPGESSAARSVHVIRDVSNRRCR